MASEKIWGRILARMADCKTEGCKEESTEEPLDMVHTDRTGQKIKVKVALCADHRAKASKAIQEGKAPAFEIRYPAYCPLHRRLLDRVGLAKDGIARRGYCTDCKQDWVEKKLHDWVPA